VRAPVLIPVKPLARAKSRLAGFLEPQERTRLVLWMLERVLRCCLQAGCSAVYVVGGDRVVEDVALHLGAYWLTELGADLNETLARALRHVRQGGRTPCLVLASDLPLLDPDDLEALWEAWDRTGGAVLAPSRDGQGTNAILIPSGSLFRPAFGPASRWRHRALLRAEGIHVEEVHRIGLAHDVDRPEDLTHPVTDLPGFPIPRLRGRLARLDRESEQIENTG
jgi:2-phospho-L-lactate guanylyltransferase